MSQVCPALYCSVTWRKLCSKQIPGAGNLGAWDWNSVTRASHLVTEKDMHRPSAGRGWPLGLLAVMEERPQGHLSALKDEQGFPE